MIHTKFINLESISFSISNVLFRCAFASSEWKNFRKYAYYCKWSVVGILSYARAHSKRWEHSVFFLYILQILISLNCLSNLEVMPMIVERRAEVETLQHSLQGRCYDLEYSLAYVKFALFTFDNHFIRYMIDISFLWKCYKGDRQGDRTI